MDENDFEGTLLLEKLAEKGLVDSFYEAVDSDDLTKVKRILKLVGVDNETLAMVLEKIENGF